MNVIHTRLLISNFAECFRFYRDVMGFKVSWGDENDTYASFTAAEGKEPMLAIFGRAEMADVIGTTGLPFDAPCQDRAVLVVGVEDVDEACLQLKSRGVRFVVEPADYPDWGMRAAYLRDPDGNLIELTGALQKSKWSEDLQEAARRYDST